MDVRPFYGLCPINERGILPLTELSSTAASTQKHSQNSTVEKQSTTQKVSPTHTNDTDHR